MLVTGGEYRTSFDGRETKKMRTGYTLDEGGQGRENFNSREQKKKGKREEGEESKWQVGKLKS